MGRAIQITRTGFGLSVLGVAVAGLSLPRIVGNVRRDLAAKGAETAIDRALQRTATDPPFPRLVDTLPKHCQASPSPVEVEHATLFDILTDRRNSAGELLAIPFTVTAPYFRSPAVRTLQLLLLGEQHADGIFGPRTGEAVMEYCAQCPGLSGRISRLMNIGPTELRTILEVALADNERFIRVVQTALQRSGYSLGPRGVDGRLGPYTRAALEQASRTPTLGGDYKRKLPDQYACIALIEGVPFPNSVSWETISKSKALTSLAPAQRERLQEQTQSLLTSELPQLEYLARTLDQHSIAGEAASQLFDLFFACTPGARYPVAALVERCEARSGVPFVLLKVRDEHTALDRLHALTQSQLIPALEPLRASFLSSLISELANPMEINQGPYGRCMASTLQLSIAVVAPHRIIESAYTLVVATENARLSESDKKLITDACGSDSSQQISHSEEVLQVVLMQAGESARYDISRDCFVDGRTGQRVSSGKSLLTASELQESLVGEPLLNLCASDGISRPHLFRVLTHWAPPGSMLVFQWRKYSASELEARRAQGEKPPLDGYGTHAVNFAGWDPVKRELLFVTYGPTANAVGATMDGAAQLDQTRCHLVDPARGIWAMSEHEALRTLRDVCLPATSVPLEVREAIAEVERSR